MNFILLLNTNLRKWRFKTLDPIVTLDTFNWVPVWNHKTSSRFIWNLRYLVYSELVLHEYFNTVQTHYFILGTRKCNGVCWLYLYIRYMKACMWMLYTSTWLHIMLYIYANAGNPWHPNLVSFTLLCRMIVGKIL